MSKYSSSGYGEVNKMKPHPSYSSDSLDHWGGKSEAMAQNDANSFPSQSIAPLSKVENPGDVDEEIWSKAKAAAEKEYGAGRWGAVSHIYEKMGGKFHRKDKGKCQSY